MKSTELRQLLAGDFNTRYIYGKVLASDELIHFPSFMTKAYIIVNNQPRKSKGEHWLGIFLSETEGNTTTKIQASESILCGMFCVYFISKRCIGVPFKEIMQSFNTKNLKNNDQIVVNYLRGQ